MTAIATDERAYDVLAARDGVPAALIAWHGRPDPFSWGVLDDAVGLALLWSHARDPAT